MRSILSLSSRGPALGLLLTLALLVLSWGGASAAPASESELPLLTLEESLKIAFEKSPRLLVAESQERQAHAQLDEAKSVLNPSLNLRGQLNRGYLNQADILANTPSSQGSLALAYNQVIARTEGIRLAIEQGELGLRASELQKQAEKLAVLSAVVNGYVGVVEARSALELSRVMARNSAEMARITADRVEVGTATNADLMAAEAAEARARQGEVVASDSVKLAHEALFQTIGLEVTESYGPDAFPRLESIDALSGAFTIQESLDTLSERALRSRPEVLQAEVALETARYNLMQFRSTDGPRAELTGSYAWADDDRSLSFSLSDRGELGVNLSQNHSFSGSTTGAPIDTWQVGAGVTWSFADGGARKHRDQQLAEQVRQAELRLKDVRSRLSTDLARRYNDVVHAMQALSIAEQEVLEATARHNAVRHQLENGSATQLEVWQAEGELIRKQHERVTATGSLIRAYTALTIASGNSAEELLTSVGGGPDSR